MWRRLIIDAIRNDPEWKTANTRPSRPRLRTAARNAHTGQQQPDAATEAGAPTAQGRRRVFRTQAPTRSPDGSTPTTSFTRSKVHCDYDPGPGLEKIKAPLLAINFADDLINPPELGILEQEIKRVKHGKAMVIPMSDETAGHGTHTKAVVWKKYLQDFLKETEK